jgi:taurine dioxygenase
VHPIARTHPDSGAKPIYINPIYINPIRIEGILGMDHKEALPLLHELIEHATDARFQDRHAREGGLVLWDNAACCTRPTGTTTWNRRAISIA